MTRLSSTDVACWVLKSSRGPTELVPGWAVGEEHRLPRCLRPSYRLGLVHAGQPALLWISGRTAPGVHAIGTVAGEVTEDGNGPAVELDLVRLADPVPRSELLADPVTAGAEVLRMAAGSNPSWLSTDQFASLRSMVAIPAGVQERLGPWLS